MQCGPRRLLAAALLGLAGAEAQTYTVPRSYAVVIGVSDYQHLPPDPEGGPAPCEFSVYRKPPLKTAAQPPAGKDTELFDLRFSHCDAESIYRELISPRGGNFRAENVRKLIGFKATLAGMRHALLEWLPAVARDPEDRVLIYFSGHGVMPGQQGYLAPWDFDPNNAAATGFPMEWLAKLAGETLRPKHKILLTDACHSGAINSRILRDLHPGVFSLTASKETERAQERDRSGGGHGVFTYYVVKGMQREADLDQSGIITAGELAAYVSQSVKQITRGDQNPTWAEGKFDPNMHLGYVPDRWSKNQPGSLILEAEEDAEGDKVRVFVDDFSKPAGVAGRGKPLGLPPLSPGPHFLLAEKDGFEPDGPRAVMVYPGRKTTVKLNIVYRRRPGRSAEAARIPPELARAGGPASARMQAYLDKLATLILTSNEDGVEVFVDGESVGVLQKGKDLFLYSLLPGTRTILGVKAGYRHFVREEILDPGQDKVVEVKVGGRRAPNQDAEKALREGVQQYTQGKVENYRRAAQLFQKALGADREYSEAALYLGRTYRALGQWDDPRAMAARAEQQVRRAIEWQRDYDEARVALAGVLLDSGDFDKAVEEVNTVLQRLPDHDRAYALLSQTFRLKGDLGQAVEAARQAVEVNRNSLQGRLYLAEALRLSWNGEQRRELLDEATREYQAYLKLSDFESSVAGKVLNYWFRGLLIGGGRKTRPSHLDAWKMLRGLAHYGLGNIEVILQAPERAIEQFEQALHFDNSDPLTYYRLGYAFAEKANRTGKCDDIRIAQGHFRRSLELDPGDEEAREMRGYLAGIDQVLQRRACQ